MPNTLLCTFQQKQGQNDASINHRRKQAPHPSCCRLQLQLHLCVHCMCVNYTYWLVATARCSTKLHFSVVLAHVESRQLGDENTEPMWA